MRSGRLDADRLRRLGLREPEPDDLRDASRVFSAIVLFPAILMA